MANEQENFSIDVDVSNVVPNEGGGFRRVPFGDYKFRIVDAIQKPKEGEKPHVMLKPTFVIVEARDPKNAHAVGMQTDGLYAGSRQSPKYMQERLACLLRAIGVNLAQGQALSKSMLVGREFDGTITWELGKPVFDEATGGQKRYVNSRICAERTVGTARPASINPEADSREAAKFLEATYGDTDAADATPADAAPWAQPNGGAQASAGTQAAAPSGFRPEADADANVMQYRVYVALKTPHAEQARGALVAAGFDPEGPINADLLVEPLKGQYLAAFPPAAQANAGALPGLPGLPPAGGNKAQKGTRSPRA